MPCFYPIPAWRTSDGGVVFSERAGADRPLTLPCGQCVGCRLERSRQWAIRCVHEAQLHEENCFLTLTYDDDHIPDPPSLTYSHFQKFMKRLRKAHPRRRIRFYMCGEYGELLGRPHYHACLFGYRPSDLVPIQGIGTQNVLYRSAELERLWSYGYSSVAQVTFESAAYVARYVMKKITGNRAEAHYRKTDLKTGEIYQQVPEFTRMSLKPGIGAEWLQKYSAEVYPRDEIILRGRSMKPPKYYDKKIKEFDDDMAALLEHARYQKSLANADDTTEDRLRVREKVTRARLNLSKRRLE